MALTRENQDINSGHANGNTQEKKNMNDIILIECIDFVGLKESSKRKEGDKYSCNILSLDNGRMMIPLKEGKKSNSSEENSKASAQNGIRGELEYCL